MILYFILMRCVYNITIRILMQCVNIYSFILLKSHPASEQTPGMCLYQVIKKLKPWSSHAFSNMYFTWRGTHYDEILFCITKGDASSSPCVTMYILPTLILHRLRTWYGNAVFRMNCLRTSPVFLTLVEVISFFRLGVYRSFPSCFLWWQAPNSPSYL